MTSFYIWQGGQKKKNVLQMSKTIVLIEIYDINIVINTKPEVVAWSL